MTDELKIPVGSQALAHGGPLPPHGMLMPRVRAGWGEPSLVHDAVGQPPITRWDYADFSVYFEHDHVVHAVATPPGRRGGHRTSEQERITSTDRWHSPLLRPAVNAVDAGTGHVRDPDSPD